MEERIFYKGRGFRLTDQRLLIGQQSIPLPQIRAMSRVSGKGRIGLVRAFITAFVLLLLGSIALRIWGGSIAMLFIPALIAAIAFLGLAIYANRPTSAVTIMTNEISTRLRFNSVNEAFKFTDVMMQIKKDIIIE